MRAVERLERGLSVLGHYPLLLLLPLLNDVIMLGAAYMGAPVVRTFEALTVGSEPGAAQVAFRAFFPAFLPSLSDLQVQMVPASGPSLGQVPTWMAILTAVGLPAVKALLGGAYLSAIGEALRGRDASVRSTIRLALKKFPAFFILALAWVLLGAAAERDEVWLIGIVWSLLFLLVPYGVGLLDLSLAEALARAPGLLWGRLSKWLGLAVATGIITFLGSGLWSAIGRPVGGALLFYPALGTVLVAAAATVVIDQEEQRPVSGLGSPRVWLAMPVVLLALASVGSNWAEAWRGWLPSREDALKQGAVRYETVAKVTPMPEGEIVIYRASFKQMGIAALRRGRFGWKPMESSLWSSDPDSGEPGSYTFGSVPDSGGLLYRNSPLIAGELFDSRVAYIQVKDQRFPVGQEGAFFLVRLPEYTSLSSNEIRFLDAAGNVVPKREVKQP